MPSGRSASREGADPVRDDGPVHGPHRGRADPARRRLPLEPLRLDGRRPLHADRARVRLDVPRPGARRAVDERQGSANGRAFIGRDAIRRELARADVALAAHRARRRLERLRPDLRRSRAHPAEGPHPGPGRVLRLRRRAEPARLRDEPDVLADAPAPHCAGAGAAGPNGRGLACQAGGWRAPPLRVLRRGSRSSPCSTRSEGRPDDGEDQRRQVERREAVPARRALDGRGPHLRRDRHRWRAQRPHERRLPGEGGPEDARPRAPADLRRRGDHGGAPAGLLVHDASRTR